MAEHRKISLEYSNVKTLESQFSNNDDEKNLIKQDNFFLCDRCGKIMANLMAMTAKRELEVPTLA